MYRSLAVGTIKQNYLNMFFKRRNSRKEEKKDNPKKRLSKNELITLYISIIALLISVGQFFLNNQFFTDKLIRPQLIIYKSEMVYSITNKGNKIANNLNINFFSSLNDKIVIGDSIALKPIITKRTLTCEMEAINIKIEKLLPKQTVIVVFNTNKNDNAQKKHNGLKLPYALSIYSDEGYGKFEN